MTTYTFKHINFIYWLVEFVRVINAAAREMVNAEALGWDVRTDYAHLYAVIDALRSAALSLGYGKATFIAQLTALEVAIRNDTATSSDLYAMRNTAMNTRAIPYRAGGERSEISWVRMLDLRTGGWYTQGAELWSKVK